MDFDAEKELRRVFQQNLSSGSNSVTRNALLRSLGDQQSNGRVENFGEFQAMVYTLSKQPSPRQTNLSATVSSPQANQYTAASPQRNQFAHASPQTNQSSSVISETNHSNGTDANTNQASICAGCATTVHATSLQNLSQRSDVSRSRASHTTQRSRSGQHAPPHSPQSNLLLTQTPLSSICSEPVFGPSQKTEDTTITESDMQGKSGPGSKKKKGGKKKGGKKESKETLDNSTLVSDVQEPVLENYRSAIYLLDDCNHIYRLSFLATNVNIIPMGFNEDVLPVPAINDKCTQATSMDRYSMRYFRRHSRELNYVHQFALCYADRKEPKKEKPIMPRYSSEVVKKESNNIAASQSRPPIMSTIHVNFENFRLRLHPTTFIRIDRVTMQKSKEANDEQEYQNKQGLQPVPDAVTLQTLPLDSANLTVFQNNDIFGIYFSMQDGVLERIIPFHQLATSTPLPDLVYCRISSLMYKKKFIFAPLPRTTYFYRDPMKKIVYKNRHNRIHGMLPEWKSQMLQEKAKKDRKEKYNEMLNRANKMGTSRFHILANNLQIRARSKVLKMIVDGGDSVYDEWLLQGKRRMTIPDMRNIYNTPVCQFCNQALQQDAKFQSEAIE